ENGTVKVTDFGIAKFTLQQADITRSGSHILGTPLYMAPEQIKGGEVDGRADLYALGVTLYEMASGHPPFFEGNIEYHHLHTPPPPLRVPLPLGLAEAILRCLAKDPEQRFQSAEELAEALAAVDCAGL
ncbi:MAG: protein kinase domain-containing protein, partial [Candidatus Sumerlaeaceae bacterium]